MQNVHHDVCCMITDDGPNSKCYYLKADNQTLKDAAGEVEVTDVESGKTVFKGKFSVDANATALVKKIPARKGQGMLLVKYTVDGKQFANHYLYGEPPYKLDDYKNWIDITGIYEID